MGKEVLTSRCQKLKIETPLPNKKVLNTRFIFLGFPSSTTEVLNQHTILFLSAITIFHVETGIFMLR